MVANYYNRFIVALAILMQDMINEKLLHIAFALKDRWYTAFD
ncbi:hypothetical protein OTSGILL_2009 [Orientia tsutsugamushi str. Gilliam]|uniref:Uncharacterized protein n=1 Tax=Orientia tsutsugamushi str. Gilliam TaxID=1359184 RepID=A0A0F3M7M7_ORITS|nr:hypothetical protein OTSGILL_2009 [Orientia tsutsugamushi str. Gilliam]